VAAPRPGPPRRKITNYNWSIGGLGVAHRDEREQPEIAASRRLTVAAAY
jgi:hypothetical protein